MHQQQRTPEFNPQTARGYRRDNMDRVNADTDRLIGDVELMLMRRRLKTPKGHQ